MLNYFKLWRIIASILVLIYTVLPFDFLPDMAVGWGWLDDIAILYLLWHFFFRGRKPGSATLGGDNGDKGAQGRAGIDGHDGAGVAQEPHEILGVSREASPEDVRSAYKALAAKYHPDKVAHLGKEFQALAEERFKAIQSAYDTLKSGFERR